ncbi:MAG: hypothetical protein CVT89_03910 [Candidatus Altiarchaeales archaeon HGW-Altiarchaeales-2]|nr:MAG: hypothetical protein CVT89_03910 [Candidatus Altiarchaeales archaeon HGW-Altiarchaeales-2]
MSSKIKNLTTGLIICFCLISLVNASDIKLDNGNVWFQLNDRETGMFSGAGETGKSSFISVDTDKFINMDETGFNGGEWQDGREYFLHKTIDYVSIIKNTNDVQAYRTIQTLETRTTGSKMQLTYTVILPKNKDYAIIQIKHKNIGSKTFTLDNIGSNIHDGTWAAQLNPENPYKAYINGYGEIDFSTVGLWRVFSPPKNKPFVTFYDKDDNAATYGFIFGTSKPIQYVTNGKPRDKLESMVGEVTLKPGEETEYVIMISLHTGDETEGEKLYDDAVINVDEILNSLSSNSLGCKGIVCNGKCYDSGECCDNSNCSSDQYCSNNKCETLKPIGSSCSEYSECKTKNCFKGTCREQGYECGSYSDCPSGKYCSKNTCMYLKEIGSSCSGNSECATKQCVDGICDAESTCGNGHCDAGENYSSCPNDCKDEVKDETTGDKLSKDWMYAVIFALLAAILLEILVHLKVHDEYSLKRIILFLILFIILFIIIPYITKFVSLF